MLINRCYKNQQKTPTKNTNIRNRYLQSRNILINQLRQSIIRPRLNCQWIDLSCGIRVLNPHLQDNNILRKSCLEVLDQKLRACECYLNWRSVDVDVG